MNFKLLFPITFLTLFLFSCSKVSKEDRISVEGTYEWFYSFNGYTQSNYYETVASKYAIKIWKGGKVIFYINSKKVKKGTLVSYVNDNDLVHISVRWDKWDSSEFDIENEQITFFGWPYGDQTNYFVKQ